MASATPLGDADLTALRRAESGVFTPFRLPRVGPIQLLVLQPHEGAIEMYGAGAPALCE